MTTNPTHLEAASGLVQEVMNPEAKGRMDAALNVLADPNQAARYDKACGVLSAYMPQDASYKAYIREQLQARLVESTELRDWFKSNAKVAQSVHGDDIASNARLVLIGLGGQKFVDAVNEARRAADSEASMIEAPPPASAGVQLAAARLDGRTAIGQFQLGSPINPSR